MNAEEIEIELLRTRGPQPPEELERRVIDAARRIRKGRRPRLSSVLALLAASLFLALVAVVVRPERPGEPPGKAGQETTVEQWTYTRKTAGRDEIDAILHADSAVVKGAGGRGIVEARGLTVRLFSTTGRSNFVIRSDSGHFDEATGLITSNGAIRVDRADGFSARAASATVDLEARTFTMSIDGMARFEDHLAKYKARPAKPVDRPKVHVSAPKAVSFDKTTTFVNPEVSWKFPVPEEGIPPFSIRFEGTEGRSDEVGYSVTGNAWAAFEDGRYVQAIEVALSKTSNLLRLSVSIK
jgi:hypothetical protein